MKEEIQVKTEICIAVADLLEHAAELPEEIESSTGNLLFLQGIIQNIRQCTKAIETYIETTEGTSVI